MTGPDGSEQFVKTHDFVCLGLTHIAGLLARGVRVSRGCGQPASQAEPLRRRAPVTVAQPIKRTVTDWDEFTGRFEAMEEVQVRARVGGFVNSVEFQDGAIVHQGDLLYVIDPRPFEAVALQADGQLADARAKVELAQRELDRGAEPGPDQRRLRSRSSTSAARPCRPRTPPRCRPKAR